MLNINKFAVNPVFHLVHINISADEFMVVTLFFWIFFKREMRNVRQIRNKKKYQ